LKDRESKRTEAADSRLVKNIVCGAEYDCGLSFSLGGEYGFRYMMSGSEMEVIQEGKTEQALTGGPQ